MAKSISRSRFLSAARAVAVLSCPILLSGCLIAFLPFGPSRTTPAIPIPTAPPKPSASTPSLGLPDLPIADLPGAPALAVWSPEANGQIRVSTWRAGTLKDELVVPLLNRDPVYLDHVRVLFSPTGRYFAVVEAADGPTISRAFVRIFSNAGDLVWTGPREVTAHPTIRWSPDGTRFAVDARLRWLVVTPGGGGNSKVVEIDTRRPVDANGGVQYPWELLDFSEDGATLFGSRSAGLVQYSLPLARVNASGGPIEPLATLPTKAGKRMTAIRQLLDTPLEVPIDPTTGRIAFATSAGATADVVVVVRSGKRDRQFALAREAARGGVFLVWQGGSLVTLHDSLQADQQLGVISTGADFGKERRVSSFPIVGQHRAGFVALTDGWVVLSFGSRGGLPEVPNRLLLVRLSDGAKTAIDADGNPTTLETYGFAGWLPGV